jgi:excisionase family DNA binding protein
LPELMTLEEVADYLRVTRKTIYRLLDKRAIPSTRVGHQWRFARGSVDDWLRQNSSGAAASILVIDDDESICGLFRDTLAEAGHKVAATSDPREGLKIVREQEIDLVFLDLKMPIMDGSQVFKEIRAAKPNLPVTIVTGFADSELMVSAMQSGPFGVMKKPFTPADIMTVVATYLHTGLPTR